MTTLHFRVRPTLLLFGLIVFLVPQTVGAQSSCFGFITNLHDVAGQPLDTEWVEITRGVDTFTWNGQEHLVGNMGNEMRIWRLNGAVSASPVTNSSWHPSPVDTGGSVFHALRGLAVCDDCRYGYAAFRDLGAVVFDLGTGSTPSVGQITHHLAESGTSQMLGGAMYKSPGGPQYLLCVDLQQPSNGSKIYEVNGTDIASLTEVVTLTTPSGGSYYPRRGQQYNQYLYLSPAWSPSQLLILDMSDPSDPTTVAFTSCTTGAFGMSLDRANAYLAVATGSTSPAVEIYDVSQTPMAPQFVGSVDASHQIWSVEIQYPYLYGSDNTTHYKSIWDISVPQSAALIDDDYWNNLDYDWNSVAGLNVNAAAFHSSGEGVYLAGKSQLQVHSVDCASVQPVAAYDVSTPVFPGDTVTVTNTSTGPWTRSAIWVTDQNQEIVVGSTVLSESTPDSRTFDVPNDIDLSASYTVHVAVESDEYPYSQQVPGDQLEEGPVTIDRTPEASFEILDPQTGQTANPITGDDVRLDATYEGHPQGVGDEIPFKWTITPPLPAEPFQESGDPSDVTLNASGIWKFDLIVDYMHTATVGHDPDADSMHEAEAPQLQLDISSVAAAFTVTPSNPLNTEAITLDGTSSNYQIGADVSFDWTVSGPTAYDGCGDLATCQIPADTLDPGSYQVSLTLTNTDNGDTSTAGPQIVQVGDGNVTLTLTGPDSRAVGENAMFSLDGAPTGASVTWNFGGPHCDGDPQTQTCTYPGDWDSCADRLWVYSTEGTKTVTADVSGVGSVSHDIEITAGSCGGTCSYSLSPSSATFNQSGGSGSTNVSTDSGCEWDASSNRQWITISSGSSGTGSGVVSYQVASNDTGSTRNGSITVEGATLSITQTASSSTLDFSFAPASPQIGQTVTFELEGLQADVDQAEWDFGGPGCSGYTQQTTCTPDVFTDCTAQGYKYSSSGEKTVTVTVTLDGSGQQDPVTHTVTVQNTGSCDGCSYSTDPTSATFQAGGGADSLSVVTSVGCAWSAGTTADWIEITDESSGMGPATVSYEVAPNNSSATREDSITVEGATLTITQTGLTGCGDGVCVTDEDTATCPADCCKANRLLPPGYVPEGVVQVSLPVTPPIGTLSYALEENVPTDWPATDVSHGGYYDSGNGQIRWGPFFDDDPRTLTYVLHPPVGAADPASFSGVISLDGRSLDICGDDSMEAGYAHQGDLDTSLTIVIDEMTDYGASWKAGDVWPVEPNPIPIDYVTNAGLIWRSGEAYQFDSGASPPWTPLSKWLGSLLTTSGGSTFSLPDYEPEVPIDVTIMTEGASGSLAYAVEDRPPGGWTVSNINENGVWDDATGKVKWGPYFDGTDRVLSYTVTPPAGDGGTKHFVGVVSTDGSSEPITGDRILSSAGGPGAGDMDGDGDYDARDIALEIEALDSGIFPEEGSPDCTMDNDLLIDDLTCIVGRIFL